VWNESRTLVAAGWEVAIISPAPPGSDLHPIELRDGIEIHRFELSPSGGGARGYLREYMQALWRIRVLVRRLTAERRFDVVHVCNPPDVLFLTARSARRRGAGFVFDHHDLAPELFRTRFGGRMRPLELALRAAEQLAFRLADVSLATNETYRNIALKRGRVAPENVFVVRNGPDLDRFQPVPADPKLRCGRPYLFAYLGIMGPQDGVDHALRALAWLKGRRTDWHAIFAGEGEVLAELRALVSDLGLDDHVEFVGWLDDPAIRTLLSTADVCIAPDPPSPLNDASTMVKIAEYMAMGCATVSYDLPESRETAGDAALYAPTSTPESLGRCMDDLLADPEQCARLGRIATDRVATKLAWQHSEPLLLAAYQRAMARRDRTRRRVQAQVR
jgi:glycosyltransferase involved in cell wall biosynthesis